jgi:hypothetical protein
MYRFPSLPVTIFCVASKPWLLRVSMVRLSSANFASMSGSASAMSRWSFGLSAVSCRRSSISFGVAAVPLWYGSR